MRRSSSDVTLLGAEEAGEREQRTDVQVVLSADVYNIAEMRGELTSFLLSLI